MKLFILLLCSAILLPHHKDTTTILTFSNETVIIEPNLPEIDKSISAGHPATSPPKGYIALLPTENNEVIGKVACSFLDGDFGTMTPFRIEEKGKPTKQFMARVDAHYHEPPPPNASKEEMRKYQKPWGWHKGVSVYKIKEGQQ